MTLAAPRAARAQFQAQGFDLQWQAPSGCLSESAARAEIAKLVRADTGESARVTARVQIDGTPQTGYVADIVIARGTSSGERTLRGPRCVEVAEAAVLIVAMVIDPEAASRAAGAGLPAPSAEPVQPSRTEPPSRAAEGEVVAPTESEPAQPEEETKTEERAETEPTQPEEETETEEEIEEPSDPRARGRLVLGILGGADAGSLPQLTALGGLFAGLAWRHSRLELRALGFLPQVEARGPAPGSSAEISLWAAALAGCLDLFGARDEPRALGACATIEAGLSSGEPRRITDGQRQSGLWLAGFAGIDARQRLTGPLHVRLHAEMGLPVLRPDYEIEPFGRVFRASPVLGRFGISAFVLFP